MDYDLRRGEITTDAEGRLLLTKLDMSLAPPEIRYSIRVHADMTWKAFVYSMKLTTSQLTAGVPVLLSTTAALRSLLVYFCTCISKELHIQVHILHTYGVPAHASRVCPFCYTAKSFVELAHSVLSLPGAPPLLSRRIPLKSFSAYKDSEGKLMRTTILRNFSRTRKPCG